MSHTHQTPNARIGAQAPAQSATSIAPFQHPVTSFLYRGLIIRVRQTLGTNARAEILHPDTGEVHSSWPNAAAACQAIRRSAAEAEAKARAVERERYFATADSSKREGTDLPGQRFAPARAGVGPGSR